LNEINIDLRRLKEVINEKYYQYLKCKERYLIFYGSAGSGKSHFIAQKLLIRILVGMKTGKRHKFLALRKTQPAVKKSVFALLNMYIRLWNIGGLVTINKTDMTFKFVGGSEIICTGLDDPEKLKSIEGITGAWLEEATEFTLQDYIQVNLRIRGRSDTYKQIILSFNPISKSNWVYRHFFEGNIGVHVHSTYKDNRFLDEEYIRVLEELKEQDKTFYTIYALGEWGELKGLIYGNWQEINEYPDSFDLDEEIVGLDFGFNNPSAAIRVGIKENNLYIDEVVYESKLTNPDLINRIKQYDDWNEIENLDYKADSAEPDRIEEFMRDGFSVYPARKGKNSVKDGIDVVKRYKIFVTRRSTNVIKEFRNYKWKEDKDGNPLDEPVKFLDHSMDAIRYAILDYENSAVVAITSNEDYNPMPN